MLALYSERIFRSHAIRIRLDWLEECLARVEGQKRGPINDRIVDKIYGEWLSSDLRANGLPTLPETINEIINIGESSYSQLLKLDKRDNNLDVDSNLDKKKWQPEPRRMLFMSVTDGSKDISAMEYQSLPFIDVTTCPGAKIRLIGTVECRRGVLLLSSSNTEYLGGSVAQLQSHHCQTNVLRKALGMEVVVPVQDNDFGDMDDDLDDDTVAQLCIDAEQAESIPDGFFDDDIET
ncbi:recQ-mediated genome instability protein 1-like isoform X2 [Oscarella lobularis]|uniref:recQ-mediated genome instability protein 1-like isoform X2 n=1 Tax=Oscarella lobularis TaxID=121494 RepID=UPI0033134105